MKVILYGTLGCHLCEQAKALFRSLNKKTELIEVDIAFNDDLFNRYGVTIPVISLQIGQENSSLQVIDELFWPFDLTLLRCWLSARNID